MTRRLPFLAAAVLTASLSTSAAAQTDPDRAATAQAIYDQATKLMEARDFGQACPKLEEVVRLVPEGLGAKLSLAECYEAQDRYASAWTLFKLVEGAAAATGQKERSDYAAKRCEAIAPKVAKLTIEVPAALRNIPGLAIERDGKAVTQAQWSVPIPIDKGTYQVTAVAGDRQWSKKVVVSRDGEILTETIGPLTSAAAATSPQAKTASNDQPRASTPSSGLGGQRIAGIAVGSGGLVALAIGAAFGGLALSGQSESNEPGNCDAQNFCTAAGLELRQGALTASYVSTAMLVTGAALLGTGIVVFATAPRSAAPERVALRVVNGGIIFSGSY